MPKRTVPAAGGALTAEAQADPVIEIAARLAVAMAAYEKLDEKKEHGGTDPNSSDRSDVQHDLENFDLHKDALKASILTQPATSLAGAMVQTAVICDQIEGVDLGGDENTQHVEFGLFSILEVLERESGVSRNTFRLDDLTGTRSDMARRFRQSLVASQASQVVAGSTMTRGEIEAALERNERIAEAKRRSELIDITDEIDTVRRLIDSAWMAADSLPTEEGAPIMTVLRTAEEKLTAARDALNVYRGAPAEDGGADA